MKAITKSVLRKLKKMKLRLAGIIMVIAFAGSMLMSMVRHPSRLAAMAASMPACPPPTTITSYALAGGLSCMLLLTLGYSRGNPMSIAPLGTTE